MSFKAQVGLVDDTGQGGSIGAMLDLDAVPEQPAKVDRHRGKPHQYDEKHRHHRQDRTPLAWSRYRLACASAQHDGGPEPRTFGSSLALAVSVQV